VFAATGALVAAVRVTVFVPTDATVPVRPPDAVAPAKMPAVEATDTTAEGVCAPLIVAENVNETVPEVPAALVSVNDVLLTTDATVSEAGIPVPLTLIPWAIPVVDATKTVVEVSVPDSLKLMVNVVPAGTGADVGLFSVTVLLVVSTDATVLLPAMFVPLTTAPTVMLLVEATDTTAEGVCAPLAMAFVNVRL
jgi:hypothetical protein